MNDQDSVKKKIRKQRLMENIAAVVEQKGLRIGEVEKAAGLSIGYLARLGRDDNQYPTSESVQRMAQALGVSAEWLTEAAGEQMTDQTEYLMNFIERLTDQTRAGLLDWGRFRVREIDSMLETGELKSFPGIEERTDGGRFLITPEFPGVDFEARTKVLSQDGKRRIRAVTRPVSSVAVAGSCFYAELTGERRIHLIPYVERIGVEYDVDGEGGVRCETVIWYELVFTDHQGGSVLPVCNTLFENAGLLGSIRKLYEELQTHEDEVRVNPGVRALIEEYMEKTAPVGG